MSDKKQIEEMAKYMYGMSIDTEADCQYVAEALYNAGYRKQREGEWVKQVKIRKQGVPILHYYQCSLCGVYLVEQANYCPNCGARMSGGEK